MGCQLHTVSALIEALSDETERIPKMSPIRPWLNMFDKLKTRYDLCLCCWHCFSGNKYLQTLLVVGDTFPVYWRCSLNLSSFRRTCVYPKKENVTGGSRLRQKFFVCPATSQFLILLLLPDMFPSQATLKKNFFIPSPAADEKKPTGVDLYARFALAGALGCAVSNATNEGWRMDLDRAKA